MPQNIFRMIHQMEKLELQTNNCNIIICPYWCQMTRNKGRHGWDKQLAHLTILAELKGL